MNTALYEVISVVMTMAMIKIANRISSNVKPCREVIGEAKTVFPSALSTRADSG